MSSTSAPFRNAWRAFSTGFNRSKRGDGERNQSLCSLPSPLLVRWHFGVRGHVRVPHCVTATCRRSPRSAREHAFTFRGEATAEDGQCAASYSPKGRPGWSASWMAMLYVNSTLQTMPMALHVFLHDAALPTCEQWQSGIAEEGFRLVLDKTLDVRQNTGFSPAVYGGRKSGFVFDLLPVTGVTSVGKRDWARIDGHDVCANFQCGETCVKVLASILHQPCSPSSPTVFCTIPRQIIS